MNSSAALAFQSEPGMTLQSDLLGALEISPDELVEFPTGLYGFPECRHFVLVASDREGFFWLQSADHSANTRTRNEVLQTVLDRPEVASRLVRAWLREA